MVDLETLVEAGEIDFLQNIVMKHVALTGSTYAERLLADWTALQRRMVKVMPRDFKRAMAEQAKREREQRPTTATPAAAIPVAVVAKSVN
jgi:glutamate synthase (NADPH/NADH) large chain